MEPGESYDIEIAIPADHTAGTYWYHPHHHGGADIQVASGMAGAVIIEGDFDDVPEIAAARERLMVLGEVVFDGFGMIESMDTLFPETAVRFLTVNGQRRRPSPCGRARCSAGGCSTPAIRTTSSWLFRATVAPHRARRNRAGPDGPT